MWRMKSFTVYPIVQSILWLNSPHGFQSQIIISKYEFGFTLLWVQLQKKDNLQESSKGNKNPTIYALFLSAVRYVCYFNQTKVFLSFNSTSRTVDKTLLPGQPQNTKRYLDATSATISGTFCLRFLNSMEFDLLQVTESIFENVIKITHSRRDHLGITKVHIPGSAY